MSNYLLHDENSAPEKAQETLRQVKEKYGFIPNLMAVMAASPALVKTYTTIGKIFEETSFSDTEKQLLLLEVSHENSCDYCVAAHSSIAKMLKISDPIIDALRDGHPLSDPQLEALRQFVRAVVKSRGHATETEVKDFLDAGYTRAQILDVLVGVGMKTLSNYTNHITDTPLDTAFQPQVWKKAS